MRTVEFDYELSPDLIAQSPVEPRDSSRLMVVDRQTGEILHKRFYELPEFLRPGDLLVHNESRVIPARLFARKPTGGMVEILLLRQRVGARRVVCTCPSCYYAYLQFRWRSRQGGGAAAGCGPGRDGRLAGRRFILWAGRRGRRGGGLPAASKTRRRRPGGCHNQARRQAHADRVGATGPAKQQRSWNR